MSLDVAYTKHVHEAAKGEQENCVHCLSTTDPMPQQVFGPDHLRCLCGYFEGNMLMTTSCEIISPLIELHSLSSNVRQENI